MRLQRIAQDALDKIKREVSVADLARRRELAPHGNDLIGLCPFHDDHEPSLVITPDKISGTVSACQAGGDVIEWVRRTEGVSVSRRRAFAPDRRGHHAAESDGRPSRSTPSRNPTHQSPPTIKRLCARSSTTTKFETPGSLAISRPARSPIRRRSTASNSAMPTAALAIVCRKTTAKPVMIHDQLLNRSPRHRPRTFSGSLVIPVMDEKAASPNVR